LNRYFYYLIINNMLINVFMYVPSILIRERFNGAVSALPLGTLIGTVLLIVFMYSINQFQGEGIPEILAKTPKWARWGILSYFSLMWFLAGTISLLAFNNMIIRFVNPDIQGINMISLFALWLIIVLAHVHTDKILYALEIILVLNIPFILLFVYKAYSNEYLTLNSILEVATYFYEIPTWSSLAASSFVFSGYANLVIFNRVFKERINLKLLWLVPILGMLNLFTSVFIPIGTWGADGVGDLNFPWVLTADALRIEFGPIERMTTLFVLLYVSISLISVIINWHVALEMIKSFRKIKTSDRKRSYFDWTVLAIFGLTVVGLEKFLRENHIFLLGEYWLYIRLPSEVFLVMIIFFLARRKRLVEKGY
jgi:hypothetical protein